VVGGKKEETSYPGKKRDGPLLATPSARQVEKKGYANGRGKRREKDAFPPGKEKEYFTHRWAKWAKGEEKIRAEA